MGRVLLPTPSQATSRGKQSQILSLGSSVCVCALQSAPGCLPTRQLMHPCLWNTQKVTQSPGMWQCWDQCWLLAGMCLRYVSLSDGFSLQGEERSRLSLSLCLGRGWILGGCGGLGELCEQKSALCSPCVLDGRPWLSDTSLCSSFWEGCCSKRGHGFLSSEFSCRCILRLLLWVCSSSSRSWPFLCQQSIQLLEGAGNVSNRVCADWFPCSHNRQNLLGLGAAAGIFGTELNGEFVGCSMVGQLEMLFQEEQRLASERHRVLGHIHGVGLFLLVKLCSQVRFVRRLRLPSLHSTVSLLPACAWSWQRVALLLALSMSPCHLSWPQQGGHLLSPG